MSGDPRVGDSSGLRQLQVATGEIERGAVAEARLAYTLNESPIRYESRSYSTSTTLLFTHSIPTLKSKEEEREQPRG